MISLARYASCHWQDLHDRIMSPFMQNTALLSNSSSPGCVLIVSLAVIATVLLSRQVNFFFLGIQQYSVMPISQRDWRNNPGGWLWPVVLLEGVCLQLIEHYDAPVLGHMAICQSYRFSAECLCHCQGPTFQQLPLLPGHLPTLLVQTQLLKMQWELLMVWSTWSDWPGQALKYRWEHASDLWNVEKDFNRRIVVTLFVLMSTVLATFMPAFVKGSTRSVPLVLCRMDSCFVVRLGSKHKASGLVMSCMTSLLCLRICYAQLLGLVHSLMTSLAILPWGTAGVIDRCCSTNYHGMLSVLWYSSCLNLVYMVYLNEHRAHCSMLCKWMNRKFFISDRTVWNLVLVDCSAAHELKMTKHLLLLLSFCRQGSIQRVPEHISNKSSTTGLVGFCRSYTMYLCFCCMKWGLWRSGGKLDCKVSSLGESPRFVSDIAMTISVNTKRLLCYQPCCSLS